MSIGGRAAGFRINVSIYWVNEMLRATYTNEASEHHVGAMFFRPLLENKSSVFRVGNLFDMAIDPAGVWRAGEAAYGGSIAVDQDRDQDPQREKNRGEEHGECRLRGGDHCGPARNGGVVGHCSEPCVDL